jgi:hypothetical protein
MGLHLSRTDTVFGRPAVSGRNLIVQLYNSGNFFDTRTIKFALRENYSRSAAESEAPKLLTRLVAEGYVEPFKYDSDDDAHLAKQNKQPPADSWRLTEKGRELARVKFIKRMTREKAVAELQAFIQRVEHINSPDAEYVYIINNAWLYGSLITDAADIGDIDLIYETEFRKGHCGYGSVRNHILARAEASGRDLDYSGMINFGDTEIERILKDRKAVISLNAFRSRQLAEIKDGYLQIVRNGIVLGDNIERVKAR